uniref:Putative odorant receptor 57 n=1 Tax=Conopomorpha sinensis TaxID=940481 RepID=A0A3Q8HD86_9NEOP|nr:putative odorant receptor 57 [Conopomorpha sinensis]
MGKIIQKRYVRCIEHYKEILWFAGEVETVFASGMTVQITTSAWVICMTVYKMVDLPFASAEFFSMFMYLFCMLAQLFIYCYYGTKLQMQSEELSLSLYRSNWLSLSPSFRRMMLFTMCRSQRPVTPKSAYVVPLSLETYIGVLRLSYTLYTFLEKK